MAGVDTELEATAEAFLEAVRETGLAVGDGVAADTHQHLVVYLLLAPGRRAALCDPTAIQTWRWQVTAVGRTQAEARDALGKAYTALNQRRLNVEGRNLWPLKRVNGSPGTDRDPAVPHKFYIFDQYETQSSVDPSFAGS